ncbi:MAG TPA: hypothetical protein VH968_11670 [Gaiellaceae bacterium]|jgi:hypothetical protein
MDAATDVAQVEPAAEASQDEVYSRGQLGAVSFPELVRAHYEWERSGGANGATESRFHKALAEFQKQQGELTHAYWATRRASAVALTVKERSWPSRLFSDQDALIKLHRATDWLARESPLADLMHHCDTLAIKVSEVLRGSPERIAMQWIFSVQSHLLGFVERTGSRASKAEIQEVCRTQAAELIEIERYYARAATKAARIVYFWGMVIGALASFAIGLLLAGLLWQSGWFDHPNTRTAQTFFICFVAGTLGAFVSVLMRMSASRFRVDYEVGRSTIRRLGSFRPFIGAVFGVMLFFLVKSGILNIELPDSDSETFFFLGSLAFLAGFNERWTNVIFGRAEQTIAATLGDSPPRTRPDADEDDDR